MCVNGNVYGLFLLYNVKYTQLYFSFDCLLFTPCLKNLNLLIIGGFFRFSSPFSFINALCNAYAISFLVIGFISAI